MSASERIIFLMVLLCVFLKKKKLALLHMSDSDIIVSLMVLLCIFLKKKKWAHMSASKRIIVFKNKMGSERIIFPKLFFVFSKKYHSEYSFHQC